MSKKIKDQKLFIRTATIKNVAAASVIGNIPNVENMDIHYASSHITTPCDFPFARDGIAAEAPD